MSPFDFLKTINTKNDYSMADPAVEKEYVPFLVNRGLSYFIDTVMYANEMNINTQLSHKMQYDYLYHSVRKKPRFSKWHKSIKDADIALISEYYKYSHQKAKQIAPLLTEEQLRQIRKTLDPGGAK